MALVIDPTVNGSSANQVRSISVSRSGNNLTLRWALSQTNNKRFNVYFARADETSTTLLTPFGLGSTARALTLDRQALASPCGSFYLRQINTDQTLTVLTASSNLQTVGARGVRAPVMLPVTSSFSCRLTRWAVAAEGTARRLQAPIATRDASRRPRRGQRRDVPMIAG